MLRRELREQVQQQYYNNLNPELYTITTKSGEPLLSSRISFGISYLKLSKFIEHPERGKVRITEKGTKLLQKKQILASDILEDVDFLAHEKKEGNKDIDQ